ncbi:amino acid permease [Dermacoccus barathri]|nr:amino acid permease [Dermacoccus barathri]
MSTSVDSPPPMPGGEGSLPGGAGDNDLRRDLKARHLNMIAIGGAIGTGLFLASAGSIKDAGPGGALVAYAVIGFMVWLLMQSLGEMSTYLPLANSFEAYGTRFVSPSFGFAQGWNYWINWAVTVAAEIAAAGIIVSYWWPDVDQRLVAMVFFAVLFTINAVSVKAFGESEFLFSSIKVLTVLVFLVVGVLMIFGIVTDAPGTKNWTTGDAPFVGGFTGLISIFMIAGFSFQGTEMIGVAAGEADEPEKTIPKAIRAVFFRILLFYVGAFIVIGFLLPYTDPKLAKSADGDITASPFTLIFEKAGVVGAASVMNAVILTAILSAGSSGLYVSTRMLYSLAQSGKAPKIFLRTNERHVPMLALLATAGVALACYGLSLASEDAYTWLVNASGLAGFITWCGIAWSHLKFRRAYVAQGGDIADLPFRAKWFPLGPIVALVMCAVVIVLQNSDLIFEGTVEPGGLLESYIFLPIFLAVWAGHKLVTKSKKVEPLEADLTRTRNHD